MSRSIYKCFALPTIGGLPACDARIILAMRTWFLARQAGLNGHKRLTARLGSAMRARDLALLMEVAGAAWPQPFELARPCCAMVTVDEMLLIGAIRAGRTADRAGFDRLLGEMMGQDGRDLIWPRLIAAGFRLSIQ